MTHNWPSLSSCVSTFTAYLPKSTTQLLGDIAELTMLFLLFYCLIFLSWRNNVVICKRKTIAQKAPCHGFKQRCGSCAYDTNMREQTTQQTDSCTRPYFPLKGSVSDGRQQDQIMNHKSCNSHTQTQLFHSAYYRWTSAMQTARNWAVALGLSV